jgi:peptidoglycan/xylan/chitin deacetylase (PgdA/CDA1 family)
MHELSVLHAQALYVGITFDDGPHNTRTRKILTILRKYNISATFFVIGSFRSVDGYFSA